MVSPHEEYVARSYRQKTVVVTGGAGFIGKHLVRLLLSYQARVRIIDNFSTSSRQDLEGLLRDSADLTLGEGSVTDSKVLEAACQGADIVFHLAALASVPHAQRDPDACFTTNVAGTYALLQAARRHGCRVVFASSAAVYGNKEGICKEDDVPAPCSWYARSKYIGELMCQQASDDGVPTVALRYFNVVGSGQLETSPSAGVLTIWRGRFTRNEPIMVHGDGRQVRDFVPVEHIVRANVQVALLPASVMKGQPINVGTGQGTTLQRALLDLKEQFPQYDQPITYTSPRAGDILCSIADCSVYAKTVQLLQTE